MPFKVNRKCDRLLYTLNDVVKRSARVSLEKDGEFVFSHPCNENIGAYCRDEMMGHALQAYVSCSLAMCVVDISKIVEIEKDQRGGIALGCGNTGAACQLLAQCHPVMEAR
jgi:hypothetical protein